MNLWCHRFTQNPNQKLQRLFALPSNKLPGKKSLYSRLSNKHDVTLTDFGKFHPAQNKNPPWFHYKTFNILTEPNEDFPHGHFELQIFILAQKLAEKF